MSSKIVIYGTTNTSAASTLQNLSNVSIANAFRNLGNWFQKIGSGSQNFNGTVVTGAVSATGLITFTGRPVADETLTICNITFTAKDSGASGNAQFNTSNTDASVTAANLAAKVNANASLTGKVTAVASGDASTGVVTLTAVVPGISGNGFDLTESMTNTSKTAFANGANTTSVNLAKGI